VQPSHLIPPTAKGTEEFGRSNRRYRKDKVALLKITHSDKWCGWASVGHS